MANGALDMIGDHAVVDGQVAADAEAHVVFTQGDVVQRHRLLAVDRSAPAVEALEGQVADGDRKRIDVSRSLDFDGVPARPGAGQPVEAVPPVDRQEVTPRTRDRQALGDRRQRAVERDRLRRAEHGAVEDDLVGAFGRVRQVDRVAERAGAGVGGRVDREDGEHPPIFERLCAKATRGGRGAASSAEHAGLALRTWRRRS